MGGLLNRGYKQEFITSVIIMPLMRFKVNLPSIVT